MATLCNQIRDSQAFINYQNQLPKQVLQKAAQGFVVTTIISLIVGSSASAALVGGALAATASVIEALARPLIRSIFPEHPGIGSIISVFGPGILIIHALKSIPELANSGFNPRTSIFIAIVKLASWIALNPDFYKQNTGQAVIV